MTKTFPQINASYHFHKVRKLREQQADQCNKGLEEEVHTVASYFQMTESQRQPSRREDTFRGTKKELYPTSQPYKVLKVMES